MEKKPPQSKPVRILDSQQILSIIPHRYPFLMVDRVEILSENLEAVGIKCISANELFFHGHFPRKPVMPGVLILEAMAQTAAALMMGNPELEGKFAYFAGIKNAKFRKQVVPGDVLKLHLKMLKFRKKLGKAEASAYVGEELASQAELIFAVD